MSNQQQFKKLFDCMTCGAQIKLSRKPDNSGWLRYNLDGVTEHKCQKSEKKQEEQQEQGQSSPSPLTVYEQLIKIQKKLDHLQQTVELVLKK
jgi:hypothetical protein